MKTRPRPYTAGFRADALAMLDQSDRSIIEVAEALGINLHTVTFGGKLQLMKGRKQPAATASSLPPDKATLEQKIARLERENAQLEKTNAQLEMDREIPTIAALPSSRRNASEALFHPRGEGALPARCALPDLRSLLRREQIFAGKSPIERVLRALGRCARQPSRFVITTRSDARNAVEANHLDRDFTATKPAQKRVPRRARCARHARQHEPQGKLLEQRRRRELLLLPKQRASSSPSLRQLRFAPERGVRVHRSVLQPTTSSLFSQRQNTSGGRTRIRARQRRLTNGRRNRGRPRRPLPHAP